VKSPQLRAMGGRSKEERRVLVGVEWTSWLETVADAALAARGRAILIHSAAQRNAAARALSPAPMIGMGAIRISRKSHKERRKAYGAWVLGRWTTDE
jgi:hypothetical protein